MKTMKDAFLASILFGGSFIILLFAGQNVEVVSPLFPIKRLDESLVLVTKRSPEAKVAYYQELIQKRFSDISYVVRENHTNILIAVSLRYATTVGQAVHLASANNVRKSALKSELEQQKKMLQRIVEGYTYKDRGQNYIVDDINYIESYEKEL